MKNTPKALKIQEKFSETVWNIRNPNKVFGVHEKIGETIKEKD
jgi:hypothetical protein